MRGRAERDLRQDLERRRRRVLSVLLEELGSSRLRHPATAARSACLRGNDNRLVGTTFTGVGTAGALIVGSTVYGIPDGLNGRTPTAAEVRALQGQPSLVERTKIEDYYTQREQVSGLLRFQQTLGPGDFTGTLMLNRRTNFAARPG